MGSPLSWTYSDGTGGGVQGVSPTSKTDTKVVTSPQESMTRAANRDPSAVDTTSTSTQPAIPRQNTAPVAPVQLAASFSDASDTNPLPPLPSTVFNLKINDDNYRPLESKGLSEQRPEIIATFEFEPIVNNDGNQALTPVGELIDVQVSSRQLRSENIARLLNELRVDASIAPIINDIERRANQNLSEAEFETKFLSQLIETVNSAKRSLSVVSNEQYIRNDILTRDDTTPNVSPVKRTLVDHLKFSDDGYKSFTDTKILLQLIDDLRNIIKSFSPQLVDSSASLRKTDVDPYAIRQLNDVTAGSSTPFNIIPSIKSTSPSDIKRGLLLSSLVQFQNALMPLPNPEDRLKALFAILSKELRVSSGLSIRSVTDVIGSVFGLTQAQLENGVFDHILGSPGKSIFDRTGDLPKSLTNMIRIQTDDGKTVFPFESSFIKYGNKTIIPGQKFYVDSIIRGREKFKTTPFSNFATMFSQASSALANIVEGTLDVNVVNTQELGLNADDMFVRFIKTIKPVIEELTVPNAPHDAFFIALLREAADDVQLKHMLVLYVMWVGINNSLHIEGSKGFFDELARAGDFSSGLNADGTSRSASGLPLTTAVADAIRLLQPNMQGDANALDAIAQLIVDRTFSIAFSHASATQDNVIEEPDSAIKNALVTLGENDPSFILRSMIEFINAIDELARKSTSSGSYFLTSKPGLTKFNSIGAHTIVLSVIEMYTSFFKMFPVVRYQSSPQWKTPRVFAMVKDPTLIVDTKIVIDELLRQPGTLTGDNERNLVARESEIDVSFFADVNEGNRIVSRRGRIAQMRAMRQKFKDEDDAIKGITNIILSIGNSLRASSSDVSAFFDPKGSNAKILDALRSSPDFDDKMSALDVAQVALSRNAIAEQQAVARSALILAKKSNDSVAKQAPASQFVDDTVIQPEVKDAMFYAFSKPGFQSPAADNLRILSIGLPAGFLEALRDRLSTFIAGQDIGDYRRQYGLQNDVIKINVYMQDMLFEDVVFKPMSFIFELGRFVSSQDFMGPSFTTRALSVDGSKFVTEDISSTAIDKSYDGVLSDEQKKELANNHLMSYLLKVYIKLLTGVDLTEDAFYINDAISDLRVDAVTQAQFEKIVTTRVSNFINRKVSLDDIRALDEQLGDLLSRLSKDQVTGGVIKPTGKIIEEISKEANIEIVDDLITMMKVFSPSSVLLGSGARRIRATSPKMFERIFHVVVDPDDFEIDYETTVSTEAGLSFMNSSSTKDLVKFEVVSNVAENSQPSVDAKTRISFDPSVRRELGDISLRQFFVTIEQLPEVITISQGIKPVVPMRVGSTEEIKEDTKTLRTSPGLLANPGVSKSRSGAGFRNIFYNPSGVDWNNII